MKLLLALALILSLSCLACGRIDPATHQLQEYKQKVQKKGDLDCSMAHPENDCHDGLIH